MKGLLLIAFLAFSSSCFGQCKMIRYPYRIQPTIIIGFPIGQFAAKSNTNHLAEQAMSGGGGGAGIYKSFNTRWTGGMFIHAVSYALDKNRVLPIISKRYEVPGCFVNSDFVYSNVDIIYWGLGGSYAVTKERVGIEPYIRGGVAFGSLVDKTYTFGKIHRKKENDNFSEQITLRSDGNNAFFFYAVGLSANVRLNKWLYFFGNAHFTNGTYRQLLSEHSTDYLGNLTNIGSFVVQQPITSIQVEFGTQFRLRIPALPKKSSSSEHNKH